MRRGPVARAFPGLWAMAPVPLLETRVGSDSLTVARVPAETKVKPGDQVRICAQLSRLHFFDPGTELPVTP